MQLTQTTEAFQEGGRVHNWLHATLAAAFKTELGSSNFDFITKGFEVSDFHLLRNTSVDTGSASRMIVRTPEYPNEGKGCSIKDLVPYLDNGVYATARPGLSPRDTSAGILFGFHQDCHVTDGIKNACTRLEEVHPTHGTAEWIPRRLGETKKAHLSIIGLISAVGYEASGAHFCSGHTYYYRHLNDVIVFPCEISHTSVWARGSSCKGAFFAHMPNVDRIQQYYMKHEQWCPSVLQLLFGRTGKNLIGQFRASGTVDEYLVNNNLAATIDEPMAAYSNEINSMAVAAENLGDPTDTIFRRRCKQDLQLVKMLHQLDPSCDFNEYGNATTLVWDDCKLTIEIATRWKKSRQSLTTRSLCHLACKVLYYSLL